MRIDDFYTKVDKSNFYLGLISGVFREKSYVQIENLELLNHRKLRFDEVIPNTINFLVVIDSVKGLFIGEVYQSKVNSSDSVHESMNYGEKENIYPEIAINVIGVLEGDKFKLAGFKTVGIADKVYIANHDLIMNYIKSVEINNYEEQKPLKNLAKISNFNDEFLTLKPNTLFDRHLLVIGTTNSGKSTSSLSILDKLIVSNKKILIIDPTGEYKDSFKDEEIKKLTLGINTTLPVGKISMAQWELIFETNENSQGAILGKAIQALRYQNKNGNKGPLNKEGEFVKEINDKLASLEIMDTSFEIKDLPAQILKESVQLDKKGEKYVYNSFSANINNWLYEKVQYVLQNTSLTNFFDDDTEKNLLTKFNYFMTCNESLYIDSSEIGTTDGVGAMIIDIISNYAINNKNTYMRPFAMYIDEVHRYTFNENYTSGLVSIAREGRKKGIFLFLTTQNPKDVPAILLGQVGTMIIHRLTHPDELNVIQNQVQQRTLYQIKMLNQGEAIITSINLLQDVYVHFEKANRNHNNKTPLL